MDKFGRRQPPTPIAHLRERSLREAKEQLAGAIHEALDAAFVLKGLEEPGSVDLVQSLESLLNSKLVAQSIFPGRDQ